MMSVKPSSLSCVQCHLQCREDAVGRQTISDKMMQHSCLYALILPLTVFLVIAWVVNHFGASEPVTAGFAFLALALVYGVAGLTGAFGKMIPR